MSTPEEIFLISRVVLLNDERAFGRLMKRYLRPVRRYFLIQTGGDEALSDDLTQETFIRVWRGLDSYKRLSAFGTWVDPSKKYPTLLFCEGGPQSPVSQFWSYRWNFQIMAANDYIIVAPNRRGLPGFGLEWNEAISGDYGGQCMKDYLTAIDEMAKEPYVDADRLGCVGASFGGYSVYWLAGHHDKRFKAFIAHDGIFNLGIWLMVVCHLERM